MSNTDPATMTDSAVNREIAELRGYRVVKSKRPKRDESWLAYSPPTSYHAEGYRLGRPAWSEDAAWECRMPRYTESLDECAAVCEAEGWHHGYGVTENGGPTEMSWAQVNDKTAFLNGRHKRQLAEALLLALRAKAGA